MTTETARRTVAEAGVTAAVQQISVTGVSLAYGTVEAARDLTFSVRPGEFVSLIGPSGCGKSTVLKAIGGLLAPSEGTVHVDGSLVVGPRPKDVAFVFQDLALYPWRSAVRNVEIALQFAGVDRKERRERAMDALSRVGLGDVPNRLPNQLSGGMQQRVAVARALASDAQILLLDEPFSALDEQTRLKLGAELVEVLEEFGKTVVFVTHSLSEATFLSDRIVVMSPRPATIKAIIEVPLDRPRHPSVMRDPGFHALTDQLSELLIEERG
jgi:NitT/TauT family transport system ATP-binding protein